MPRDLELEQQAIGRFGKETGGMPSTQEDWSQVHGFAYGDNLPEELQQLPVNQTPVAPPVNTPVVQTPQVNTPTAPTPTQNQPLNFRGADISDTSLNNARDAYDQFDMGGFTDKVKERLQKKFKPETEVLGLSAFANTLGPLDPRGVMKGINDKSNQFRRKGALALQAITTGQEAYGAEATRAYDNMSRLEGMREAYEEEQTAAQDDIKSLALMMAEQGADIPQEILALLPQDQVGIYQTMAQEIKAMRAAEQQSLSNSYSGGGYGGDTGVGSGDGYSGTGGVGKMGKYGSLSGKSIASPVGPTGLLGVTSNDVGTSGGIRPKYGNTGWECAEFSEQLVNLGTPNNTMGDLFTKKAENIDKYGLTKDEVMSKGGFKIGDVIVTDGSDVTANRKPFKWGHVMVVGGITPDGKLQLIEANRRGDGVITNDRVLDPNHSGIYGAFRGTYKPLAKNKL